MAMTELKEPEKVFGERQEMRYIRFYDTGDGVYRYVLQTECPNCKGDVSVLSDGILG